MKRKSGQHVHGRSYRGAESKRQRLRKEEQKQAKYSFRPLFSNNIQPKRSGQRGG